MTSYIVSAFSKIGMMAAVVAASLFPTSLSAQDVAGAADAAELALAGETPVLDSGNTAWLIVATVLVLLMSIPGIALFYGGLVRQKNVLSVIMQTMFIVGVVSILWVAFGYCWAFGTGFMPSRAIRLASRYRRFRQMPFCHGITIGYDDAQWHSRTDVRQCSSACSL